MDLLPISEISIQGIGGIFRNLFHVSYIPQRYRNTTLFRVENHSVTEGSWEKKSKDKLE